MAFGIVPWPQAGSSELPGNFSTSSRASTAHVGSTYQSFSDLARRTCAELALPAPRYVPALPARSSRTSPLTAAPCPSRSAAARARRAWRCPGARSSCPLARSAPRGPQSRCRPRLAVRMTSSAAHLRHYLVAIDRDFSNEGVGQILETAARPIAIMRAFRENTVSRALDGSLANLERASIALPRKTGFRSNKPSPSD